MSDESKEKISAIIDGELGTGSESIIDELLRKPLLQGSWARYHLISDSLQQTVPDAIDINLAARISACIQSEPAILAPTGSRITILKPLAGLAIAASVAAIAILGIQQNQIGPNEQVQEVVSFMPQPSLNPVPVRQVAVNATSNAQQKQNEASSRARLNSYLANYNEYRTHSGFQGMLPYVRTVTFENNK
jgi:sigma-E factor negative regulatory protein RseA